MSGFRAEVVRNLGQIGGHHAINSKSKIDRTLKGNQETIKGKSFDNQQKSIKHQEDIRR